MERSDFLKKSNSISNTDEQLQPPPNINVCLPYDCLIIIFHRLPLNTLLLRARLVCTEWAQAILTVLRSKRHLTIFCTREATSDSCNVQDFKEPPSRSPSWQAQYSTHCLILGTDSMSHITQDQMRYFQETFSRVVSLDIRHCGHINWVIVWLASEWWGESKLLSLRVILFKSYQGNSDNSHHPDDEYRISRECISQSYWGQLNLNIACHYRNSLIRLTLYDHNLTHKHRISLPRSRMAKLRELTLDVYTYLPWPTASDEVLSLFTRFPALEALGLSRDSKGPPIKYIHDVEFFLDTKNPASNQSKQSEKKKKVSSFQQLTKFVSFDAIFEQPPPFNFMCLEQLTCPLNSLTELELSIRLQIPEFLLRSRLHQLPYLRSLTIRLGKECADVVKIRKNILPQPSEDRPVYRSLKVLSVPITPHWLFTVKKEDDPYYLFPQVEEVKVQNRIYAVPVGCRECSSESECHGKEWHMMRSFYGPMPALKSVNVRGKMDLVDLSVLTEKDCPWPDLLTNIPVFKSTEDFLKARRTT